MAVRMRHSKSGSPRLDLAGCLVSRSRYEFITHATAIHAAMTPSSEALSGDLMSLMAVEQLPGGR